MKRSRTYVFIRQAWLVASAASGLLLSAMPAVGAEDSWSSRAPTAGGKIVVKTVIVEDEDGDPSAAGKTAGEALKKAMGDVALKAVILSESFEDKEYKQQVLAGVCSALPKEIVTGGTTYGSFTQNASLGFDAVALLGIGGDGIGVSAALVTGMGARELVYEDQPDLVAKRLNIAGAKLTVSASVLRMNSVSLPSTPGSAEVSHLAFSESPSIENVPHVALTEL